MKRTTASNIYIARLIPPFASVTALLMALAFAPVLPLSGLTMAILGGLSAFTVGEYAWHKLTKTRLDRFFEEVYPARPPYVITKNETGASCDYRVSLPPGMSTDILERDRRALEQYLNASVTISYKNGAIISVTKRELKPMYEYEPIQTEEPLSVCIGHSIDGPVYLDIEQAPHVLIAGATGSGKSVLLRSIITSLVTLKSADLYLVDFQRVELGIFKNCGCVKQFVTEPQQFTQLLAMLRRESDRRLQLFDEQNAVNIRGYTGYLPYIVVIIDEFAALADNKAALAALRTRIAQDRKAGIHYVVCTQRPSVDVVSGSLKANIPVRVAMRMSTETDSRVVLDDNIAATLRGKGHGVVKTDRLTEFQGMFLSETQAYNRVKHTIRKKVQTDDRTQPSRPPRNPLY